MKRLRQVVARSIWDVASWIYPYAAFEHDEVEKKGWEITAYIEATEQEAHDCFDRMSDAACGVDHHALDMCPGPPCVMGMHPAEDDEPIEVARG